MRGFKKKTLQRIVQILLLVLILLGAEKVAEEVVMSASWEREYYQDIQTLAKDKEQVDMILVGASRTIMSYVPQILEEELGLRNVVNAGSNSQTVYGSYFMLKDLLEKFDPEYALINVTWDGMREEKLQADLLVMDRISQNLRIPMAWEVFPDSLQYVSYLYRLGGDRGLYIDGAIQRIVENGGINVAPQDGDVYIEKGYVFSHRARTQGSFPVERYKEFDETEILPEMRAYLDKMVELCREHGVQYYFVTGPTSMERIWSVEGYQDAVDYYQQYAQEQGSKYFNLNYLKGRETFFSDEHMRDANHVNGEGAREASTRLAQILKEEWAGEDTSGYFYRDLQELKDSVERIVAADLQISRVADALTIQTGCFANGDIVPEYRILIYTDGAEYQELFPYSAQTLYQIEVAEDQPCKIRVEVRQQGKAEYDAFAVVSV